MDSGHKGAVGAVLQMACFCFAAWAAFASPHGLLLFRDT